MSRDHSRDRSQELMDKLDELSKKSEAFVERETAICEELTNYCQLIHVEVQTLEKRQRKLQDLLKNVNNI